jgi:hypothetical protein
MEKKKKSLIQEVVDILEPAGFEIIGFDGLPYPLAGEGAKVTIRRLLPEELQETRKEQ